MKTQINKGLLTRSIHVVTATFLTLLISQGANAATYPTQFVRALSDDGSEYVHADSTGKTLYTFDSDIGAAAPTCNEACAEKWPPVLLNDEEVESTAAPFGVIARESGLKQLTHNGNPLYTFHLDRKAGDLLGDNLGDVWHDIHQDVSVAGCTLENFVANNAPTVNVAIMGFQFSPKCLRIKKGSNVTIAAANMHPVSALANVLGFENPIGTRHTSNFTVNFSKTGIFGYFCENHGNPSGGGMSGAIEVVE